MTLTFSNKWYAILARYTRIKFKRQLEGYDIDNTIATTATRLFLERWRKKYKTSLRHWLVTELGHNGTENIHLHGIIWTDIPLNTVEKLWSYGWMWKGKGPQNTNYVNEKTVNYIVKYMSKMDEDHKHYKAITLTSPGIGGNYKKTEQIKRNTYSETQETNEKYRTQSGHEMALPIYYRNMIYSDAEKEPLS